MKKFIIDRLENKYAVCEDENKNVINFKISELPKNIREGDAILILENGEIIIDEGETKKRRKNISKLQDELWK